VGLAAPSLSGHLTITKLSKPENNSQANAYGAAPYAAPDLVSLHIVSDMAADDPSPAGASQHSQ
jgi:hypothetical protein